MKQYITRFTNWYLTANIVAKVALFPVLLMLLLAALIKLIAKGFPNVDSSNNTQAEQNHTDDPEISED